MTIRGTQFNSPVIQRFENEYGGRLFRVSADGDLTLENLVIEKGYLAQEAEYTHKGGAIYVDGGKLTITHCILRNNNVATEDGYGYGGAIYTNYGYIIIRDSIITNNGASDGGGGIYLKNGYCELDCSTLSANSSNGDGGGINAGNSILWVIDTTISGNTATGGNGAGGISLFWSASVTIKRSTISENSASQYGGGLAAWESSPDDSISINLINSTLANNSAGQEGGGLWGGNAQSILLENCTISGNNAGTTGGGITWFDGVTTGSIFNTIIAGNGAAGDCDFSSSYTAEKSHNWFGDPTCGRTGDGDPNLGLLLDNGGSTKTMALLPGSGAIDAAGKYHLRTDQRGEPRSLCKCDIGSYEVTEVNPDNTSCKGKKFYVIPAKNNKTVIIAL